MGNIAQWLKEEIEKTGEPIEAIVVGVILSAEAGFKALELGSGSADCFPMYAWTKDRVYLLGEPNGASGFNWEPRNPSAEGEDAKRTLEEELKK